MLGESELKICIIGGGPAGIMAAIQAANKGHDVEIIEKNDKIGKKLSITGKGRCNLTYVGDTEYFLDNVVTNPKFMMSAINAFTNVDLIEFVENLGIMTKKERGNRVFLSCDDANVLTDALYKEIKRLNVKVRFSSVVSKILVKDEAVYGVLLDSGEELITDKILIATGGTSYPATGSTGDGCKLAIALGHSIIELKPALVPIIVHEKDICSKLEGLTLKNITAQITNGNKIIDSRFGEIVFTKNGVSGPIILSASSKINKIPNLVSLCNNKILKLHLDLKPALTFDELYKRLTRDFDKYKNKELKNALYDLLPKSIIPEIIYMSKVTPNKQVNSVTKQERESIVKVIKDFTLTLKGLGSIYIGIVTSGGVNTKEINPKTMESKLITGLYFAGEIIDVDAYTGGFNLQIAFSTGYLAGQNM